MTYDCDTKSYNSPFTDDKDFQTTVINLREMAKVWGWILQEQEA